MDKKELVVAVYKEDISWINLISKLNLFHKITIYNKGERNIADSIVLPNVGREAHTWVHHIVTNYHNLADLTVFLQGDPFAGFDGVDVNNFVEHLSKKRWNLTTHEPLFRNSLTWDYTGHSAKCYAKYLAGPVPAHIMFASAAQWVVPKENILSKSLSLYKNILQELSNNKKINSDGIVNAWTMEGTWNYIFDKNISEKTIS